MENTLILVEICGPEEGVPHGQIFENNLLLFIRQQKPIIRDLPAICQMCKLLTLNQLYKSCFCFFHFH